MYSGVPQQFMSRSQMINADDMKQENKSFCYRSGFEWLVLQRL